ncbi:hypothetical protein POPTR_011G068500v4 [Populus trichocarpa]|nr:hypothetical protein POPTR_011G068500v4 [Populus trichocarpa]|eukprot:XP_024467238.1 probable LRR receptor-like serine/threonine-protein kinase At3g47570 isoform X2 [Populus trichocarpa]
MSCVVAFLLLISCLIVCLAIPHTNTTDELALMSLKKHITFDPGNILANNWSTATSFCSWIGVACSAGHQRVTSLNLYSMRLEGTLPPQVGNLSFLVSINLSNNSFHGYLPRELTHLHRLKDMNLAYNNFAGDIPSSWFAMLPQLQHLFLTNNSLAGSIPSSLFNVTALETLNLEGNFIEGNISEEIRNLSNLKILDLGHNHFSGVISPILFNMPSLRLINLRANSLSGILQVVMIMSNIPSTLEVLNLGYNQLHGRIPSNLHKCTELRVLDLESNRFTGSIPKEICTLTKLKELYLGKNNLTGQIPGEIARLVSLEKLGLEVNGLNGNIPREIGNCTYLMEIHVENNNLTGVIPNEMGNLHTLQELDLGFNNITGSIPSTFFNFSILRRVNMAYNYLSGHLPSNTGLGLPNLEELYLEKNELSGPIPDSIGNASKLIVLDLSYNSFSGRIPDLLGNLRNLQKLNLAENILTSKSLRSELSFLSSLSNCRSLAYLRFNGNPLRGRLPVSIGNLSASLEELYAFDCRIIGNIPRGIGNLSNLIGLILQQNELTGAIPSEIGRLKHLQDFSLASNKLQGHIPNEICHLERLSYLYLLENGFSGSLPACLSNITSLRELYLGSNRFTSIPTTFWSLKDLLQINLSFNSLTGTLPLEIGNLKVVTVIDFSSNQLSGDIPTSIADLQNLAHFSLSDNRMQGPIPSSFGDLVSLEFLDLSRNSLSGAIPKSLEKLVHLKTFNVSFNRLQGEILDGGPFANFSFRSFMDNEALCGPIRMQVPPCKSISTHRQSKRPREFVIRYIVPAIAFIILVLALAVIIFRRSHKRKLSTQEDPLPPATWRKISYHELYRATEGFNETNLLGTGSCGSVYKGTLSDGLCIAVKVFHLQLEGELMRFDSECEVLRMLRHRNLVKIISSCCNLDFKALILEFIPHGSLEKWLYSHNYYLDILQRLNIMIDVASALEYLHHGCTRPVVHCDLKPSNVLINEDMVAHVSDFGISRLLGEGDAVTQTLTLATIGYMAPEYGLEGIVSVKGDVYSYGIFLMETFTRKKPTDDMFGGEMSLKNWVKQSLPKAITEVIDANLLIEEEHFVAKKDCITSILNLALECSADLPGERICMRDVLPALEKIKLKYKKDVER